MNNLLNSSDILKEVQNSVCKIFVDGQFVGCGYHFGGPYIATCAHVLSDQNVQTANFAFCCWKKNDGCYEGIISRDIESTDTVPFHHIKNQVVDFVMIDVGGKAKRPIINDGFPWGKFSQGQSPLIQNVEWTDLVQFETFKEDEDIQCFLVYPNHYNIECKIKAAQKEDIEKLADLKEAKEILSELFEKSPDSLAVITDLNGNCPTYGDSGCPVVSISRQYMRPVLRGTVFWSLPNYPCFMVRHCDEVHEEFHKLAIENSLVHTSNSPSCQIDRGGLYGKILAHPEGFISFRNDFALVLLLCCPQALSSLVSSSTTLPPPEPYFSLHKSCLNNAYCYKFNDGTLGGIADFQRADGEVPMQQYIDYALQFSHFRWVYKTEDLSKIINDFCSHKVVSFHFHFNVAYKTTWVDWVREKIPDELLKCVTNFNIRNDHGGTSNHSPNIRSGMETEKDCTPEKPHRMGDLTANRTMKDVLSAINSVVIQKYWNQTSRKCTVGSLIYELLRDVLSQMRIKIIEDQDLEEQMNKQK